MAYNATRALELLRLGTQTPTAAFRPAQEEAIQHLVEGRGRLLVVQKTGWGKSFVYFIATRLLREQGFGPALLISPLPGMKLVGTLLFCLSLAALGSALSGLDTLMKWNVELRSLLRQSEGMATFFAYEHVTVRAPMAMWTAISLLFCFVCKLSPRGSVHACVSDDQV